jgi:DHA2 family multidrug resistance protein
MMMAAAHASDGGKWVSATIVTLGIFMALLDTTIVSIVLPKMMAALETDYNGIQMVVISYLLGSAISMAAVGWLGDRFGAKAIFLAGLGIFTGMSVLCGMAASVSFMNTVRFCQGIGEGFIIPTGLVVLYETFPREEHGMAMGFYGLGASFAPALGPTVGGLITAHFSWRWIFYVNLPIGIFATVAGWFLLKRVTAVEKPKVPFDGWGFIFMAISLSSLILFLSKGQEHGWLQSDYILTLLLIFVIAFILFLTVQLRRKEPLLNVRLFSNRTYAIGVAILALFALAAYGFWLLLPVYLERLRQFPTLTSGLIMLPGSIAGGFTIIIAGILSDRWRPKIVLLICLVGAVVMSFGFHTGVATPKSQIIWDYAKWIIFVSASFVPVTVIALSVLTAQQINMGSTILNVVRLIFGCIGTAFAVSLFSSKTATFYTILASKVHYGAPATRGLIGKELLLYGNTFVGPTLQKFQVMLQGYISSHATAYAFEATFHILGIMLCAALLGALFVRHRKTSSTKVMMH